MCRVLNLLALPVNLVSTPKYLLGFAKGAYKPEKSTLCCLLEAFVMRSLCSIFQRILCVKFCRVFLQRLSLLFIVLMWLFYVVRFAPEEDDCLSQKPIDFLRRLPQNSVHAHAGKPTRMAASCY